MTYQECIQNYVPKNSQEALDQKLFLQELPYGDQFLKREHPHHLTVSAIILNQERNRILLAFHRIYQSFAWLGGHADGEKDLEKIARKEIQEECGLEEVRLLSSGLSSLEILPVPEHYKSGVLVPAHQHYNVTFLFEADENQPIRIKEDENTSVAWIPIKDLEQVVQEKEMIPIYQKSIQIGQMKAAWSKPLLSWYASHQRDLPWRKTKDPYLIWVSEIMLQQTRVEAVKRYYDRFLHLFPDISSLAHADETVLMKAWEGLGYYSRARNLQKAAKIMVEHYQGKFPSTYEEVLSLPGIGEYTAGAIMSRVHLFPVASIDGNVLRVLSRLLRSNLDIKKEKTKQLMKTQMEEILPHDVSSFNQAWMELGALVCLPNGDPLCEECPLHTSCLAHFHQEETQYPKKGKAALRKIEEKIFVFLLVRDKLLIERRPKNGLLASLYQPLEWDEVIDEISLEEKLRQFGAQKISLFPLRHQKHIFTHKIWEMNGFFARVDHYKGISENQVLVTLEQLDSDYPLPSAFKGFLKQIREDDLRKEHL